MRRVLTTSLMGLAAVACLMTPAAAWERPREAARRAAACTAWHGPYYHAAWGSPVALVVPPTTEYQTKWRWGVPATRITPIYHQFQAGYPGAVDPSIGLYGTPRWPSHTDQFGVYYVRGPW